MIRLMPFACAALALAAPALAEEPSTANHAETRLRGCLQAGSSAVTRKDLQGAVIEVRAYCGAQINRVRKQRVAVATQGLEGEEARIAEDRAVRALNREIAWAVANFTGLSQ
ncbi:MAG TPA: hypothetical protein PK680_01270 [Novosphingobium sp.]|jgi:hypothetical protein|nr:hypothetical protein [Novosphingobium sp.]HQA16990.1 hypothetical protein [Novosphingobium sp.]